MITKKEHDAMQIAGFNSVSELLKRYFELLKVSDRLSNTLEDPKNGVQ